MFWSYHKEAHSPSVYTSNGNFDAVQQAGNALLSSEVYQCLYYILLPSAYAR